MKCALGQMRVVSGRPDKNIATMKAMIDQVKGQADVIVFPEMCVGGYFIADLYQQVDYQQQLLAMNQALIEYAQDIAIIWGNIDRIENKLYNAAYFAYQGEVQVTHKALLPTYGVFDDARYFHAGNRFEPFVFKDYKLAVQICEDLWDRQYDLSPTQEALKYHPDVLINISCSPWIKGKENVRREEIQRQNLEIPFVYVNCVGTQNTGKSVLIMDGNSQVITMDAVYSLNDGFEEELEVVDLRQVRSNQATTADKLQKGLVTALRQFDEETLPFKPKWVVGVSGGLDSSVSVALCCEAFGPERVIGVTMPSEFTRDITKSNAYHLSKALGFKLLEIPIKGMVDATQEALGQETHGLTHENIQARLRGHTLMSIASMENGVVINNGNKIEVALGYATLYGDAIGAISVLGDITKMELGEVARSLNKDREIIPTNLIPKDLGHRIEWTFAPSAELAKDQFDPMKWGYHDLLVVYLMKGSVNALLESYLDKSIYETKLGGYLKAYGLDDPKAFLDDLDWVLNTLRKSVFKRIQMPPIVLVSELGFGSDYRETQLQYSESEETKELRAAILNMGP